MGIRFSANAKKESAVKINDDKNLENIESIILPLKLRLSKAYVSVIRELYIRCFLKKNGFNVKYNYDDDVNHDIDMWVEVNGEEIPVVSLPSENVPAPPKPN